MTIRDTLDQNGIGSLDNLQILPLEGKVEWFVKDKKIIAYHLGKNYSVLTKKISQHIPETTQDAKGLYFYWYTFPLMNYYHCINDGLGPLANYLELKKQYPNLQLLLNPNGRKVSKHPPFVLELLELLNIDWQYSNVNCNYEKVFYSCTLVNDLRTGKRCKPHAKIYDLIQRLVRTSRKRFPDVPRHQKIYLSRRAHANPLKDRKQTIGEDNTLKRGITNEDDMVEIMTRHGWKEVFGENYSLGEKISMFSHMEKYISTAGAGVTNILWRINQNLITGGIHSPGFPFPSDTHNRHIVAQAPWMQNCNINIYPGAVVFEDPIAGARDYNSPWKVNNLVAFKNWIKTL
jgi:hypothetical protein